MKVGMIFVLFALLLGGYLGITYYYGLIGGIIYLIIVFVIGIIIAFAEVEPMKGLIEKEAEQN